MATGKEGDQEMAFRSSLNGVAQTMLIMICGSALVRPAAAADADFARALNEAGCVLAGISILREQKDLKVYEVTCLDNPPRKVILACVRSTCSVHSAGHDADSGATRR